MLRFAIAAAALLLIAPIATAQCCGPQGCVPSYSAPMMVAPAAPSVVWRPSVTYQPYQLQSSSIVERRYHTPVRNMLFGRYRVYNQYAPMQGQSSGLPAYSRCGPSGCR